MKRKRKNELLECVEEIEEGRFSDLVHTLVLLVQWQILLRNKFPTGQNLKEHNSKFSFLVTLISVKLLQNYQRNPINDQPTKDQQRANWKCFHNAQTKNPWKNKLRNDFELFPSLPKSNFNMRSNETLAWLMCLNLPWEKTLGYSNTCYHNRYVLNTNRPKWIWIQQLLGCSFSITNRQNSYKGQK